VEGCEEDTAGARGSVFIAGVMRRGSEKFIIVGAQATKVSLVTKYGLTTHPAHQQKQKMCLLIHDTCTCGDGHVSPIWPVNAGDKDPHRLANAQQQKQTVFRPRVPSQ